MKFLDGFANILLVLGGLIWGMVGVADFNPVMWVFIAMYHVQHAIYIAMGLAAIWKIIRYFCGCSTGMPTR
jgi:uncharacterized membrane protein YuzA (DUF378 family)